MSYTIKKLQASDLAVAQQLITVWQKDDGILDGKLPGNEHLMNLLSQDRFHVYVALVEDAVVGGLTAYELQMFDAEVREMFLYEIGVIESHRQRGIASALIEALKQTCLERGIEVIFVGTEVDNEAANQLYTSTGSTLRVIAWYEYDL